MSKKTYNSYPNPDTLLKDFWSDNDRFADLVNTYLSKNFVNPDELTELDTDMSVILEHDDHIDFSKGARDLIKTVKVSKKTGACFLIIGIENQCYIDYTMPVRAFFYDGVNYAKQIKAIANSYNKEDLKPGNEYLSGIKKSDRIMPIYTIVIYYGDEPWDGPKSIHEMFRPENKDNLPYLNDYRINLLEVRNNDLVFHNKNNIDFFTILKIFYDKSLSKEVRKKKAIQYAEEQDTNNTVILSVAKAANINIDYSKLKKNGGKITMCELFEDIKTEGINEGIIKGYIISCRDLNVEEEKIIEMIMSKYNISKEECNKYIEEVSYL